MTVPIPGGEYLTTKEAVIALGISKATLYRRKNEGFFQHGIHYVKEFNISSEDLKYYLKRVAE